MIDTLELTDDLDNTELNKYSPQIFRYKFNSDVIDSLTSFAKLHEYDSRNDYKEAWKLWYESNNDILQREADRITELGYSGNIEDKMYKAARYYFRKKKTQESIEDSILVVVKKRTYLPLNREFLDAIDRHILNNIDTKNYTPASGFDNFCQTNTDILAEEIKYLKDIGELDKHYISSKIKKTYKNRYFQYTRKIIN
mgnify:CR=1 FL=1